LHLCTAWKQHKRHTKGGNLSWRDDHLGNDMEVNIRVEDEGTVVVHVAYTAGVVVMGQFTLVGTAAGGGDNCLQCSLGKLKKMPASDILNGSMLDIPYFSSLTLMLYFT
jgi:hypothetical protein